MDSSEESDTVEADGPITSTTVNYIQIEHVDNLQSGSSLHKPQPAQSPVVVSVREKSNVFGTLVKFSRRIFGDTTCGLKEKLRNFYSEATLPCIAWLDEGHDLLMSDYYVRLQLDNNSTSISLEDIFTKTTGVKPTRILIEGQPGYGKTTLATKLVFDWANGLRHLRRFKLAFLLPLRELKQRSVKTAMEDIARLTGFTDYKMTERIIEDNLPQTLLVLDGLDELPLKERINVLQILFKQLYQKMTVVVTCRTGLFSVAQCELNTLFGGVSKKKLFYDKRVVVVGIGVEDREKFLSKFLNQQNARVVLKNLQELTVMISNIFQSPLFLILLSMFMVKKKEMLNLTTQTTLYKTLINCIIRHSVGKRGLHISDSFDIFEKTNIDESTQKFKTALYHFGLMCLDKIETSNLQFECNDLTSTIYEMGLLINHKNISFFESNQHFEAFHLSVMEFAAAFALYTQIENSGNSLDERTIRELTERVIAIHFHTSNTSLLLPFLFGLLKDKSVCILQQLQPIAHLSSCAENIFWAVLAECTINEQFLSAVSQYIPPQIRHWDNRLSMIFQSSAHEQVLRQGIHSKKVVGIWTNTKCPSRLPKDVIIPHLAIVIHIDKSRREYDMSQLRALHCREISFTLLNILHYENETMTWQYLQLFCSIPAKKRSLSLNGGYSDEILLKNIDCEMLQQVKLQKFVLALNGPDGSRKELLFILLKRNQIKFLDLIIALGVSRNFCNRDYSELMQGFADSEYLDSLRLITLHPFCFDIDLYLLTNGGKKTWDILILKFFKIYCSKPLTQPNCIKCLITKVSTPETTETIANLQLNILECENSTLQTVTTMTLPWASCNTLSELILLLDKSSEEELFWMKLTNLKRLKLFEVIIPISGALSGVPVDKMVDCLQLLPIERFVLWRACRPGEDGFTKKLIEQMMMSFPWRLDSKRHPLTTFDLFFVLTTDQTTVNDIRLCLAKALDFIKLRYLDNLNIICNNVLLWYSLMEINIIDHSVFKVTHSLPGVSETDPTYYKVWYDNFLTLDNNQFCISLR